MKWYFTIYLIRHTCKWKVVESYSVWEVLHLLNTYYIALDVNFITFAILITCIWPSAFQWPPNIWIALPYVVRSLFDLHYVERSSIYDDYIFFYIFCNTWNWECVFQWQLCATRMNDFSVSISMSVCYIFNLLYFMPILHFRHILVISGIDWVLGLAALVFWLALRSIS